MNSRKRWLIRICSMMVFSNDSCSFDLLHRFWHSPNCLTIMVCLDLALCLFSSVEKKKSDMKMLIIWDLSSPFLKETALLFILLGSICVGLRYLLVTYLIEKREYSNKKCGLKIFVHCFEMYWLQWKLTSEWGPY